MSEPTGLSDVLGVLLCGGASRRMGSDKGLLPLPASMGDAYATWSEKGLALLRETGLPAVLSLNAMQENNYTNAFPHETRIRDSEPGGGPLRGILSVHRRYPRKSLLVLACDMLHIAKSTLILLLDSYQGRDAGHEAIAFRVNQRLEPLCALYTPDLLARAGTMTAPRDLLAKAQVLEIDGDDRPGEFISLNHPDQIR